jgi:hypothetical protein
VATLRMSLALERELIKREAPLALSHSAILPAESLIPPPDFLPTMRSRCRLRITAAIDSRRRDTKPSRRPVKRSLSQLSIFYLTARDTMQAHLPGT